jgi:hypothetical protein
LIEIAKLKKKADNQDLLRFFIIQINPKELKLIGGKKKVIDKFINQKIR